MYTGCYPFQDDDPLLVKDCPHIYIAGNQPRFQKRVIEGPAGQRVLLLAVPKFRTKRVMVVVDMESMEVEIVKFSLRRPAKAAKAAKAAN
jgi:DNA polymerase delta subunit 2